MNRIAKVVDIITGGEITKLEEGMAFVEAVNADLQLQLEEIGWERLTSESENVDVSPERRKKINSRALLLWRKDPLVGHAVNLTNWFTFGEGVSAPKVNDADGKPNDAAQKAVNEFWYEKDNQKSIFGSQAQWKLSTLLQVQGEIFLTLFKSENGMKVRSLMADTIEDIVTHPEDKDTPLFYKRNMNPTTYDFGTHAYTHGTQKYKYHKDAAYDESIENLGSENVQEPNEGDLADGDIYHIKINTLGKRGFSELYRAFDWVNAFNVLASARVSHARAENTFAWERKTKGGQADITAAKANLGQSGNPTNRVPPAPGSFLFTGQGQEYKLHEPSGGGAKAASDDLRSLRLHVATAFNAPEHYFADGSQGNMATAKTMELWALKKFLARQKLWEEIYKDLVYAYLEIKGISSDDVVIDIDFPQIQNQDVFVYLQALQIAKANGFLSDDTIATLALQSFGVNNVADELVKMKAVKTASQITANAKMVAETIKELQADLNGAHK